MNGDIAVAALTEQQIVADPLIRSNWLLLRVISGMVEKHLIQKIIVLELSGRGQMRGVVCIEADAGAVVANVDPVYLCVNNVFACSQIVELNAMFRVEVG
jgi:hypothetical protein